MDENACNAPDKSIQNRDRIIAMRRSGLMRFSDV